MNVQYKRSSSSNGPLQGEKWKSLRKRYNAGFAPSHLLTLLPRIMEKTAFFISNLDALAESGNEFSMEFLCTSLTFDIIGMHKVLLPKPDIGGAVDGAHHDRSLHQSTFEYD